MNRSTLSKKQLGALGEAAAEQYLRKLGYTIIGRNWRCRSGEIDLIAEEGDTLIFVEVRTRSSSSQFGTPAESVDFRKQRQVTETAQVYLLQKKQYDRPIRFDVISVQTDSVGVVQTIEQIRSAF
ncbi:YraN family protein [Paenibacillus cremeus]|uniref:UPF0102 protein FPZ49_17265 n=1 Tax=Paenibacillus cremeus TaxID=2163881 RepID=A0A559K9J6_9BACL|nr:YraN family protein [Paenibacillus cremeus]TVY08800.1 YraN family protein [Paenibacillus cremeus]